MTNVLAISGSPAHSSKTYGIVEYASALLAKVDAVIIATPIYKA